MLEADFIKQGVDVQTCRIGYLNLPGLLKFRSLIKKGNYKTICDFTGDFAGFPLMIASCCKIKNRIAFYRGSTHHFKTDWLRMLYWRAIHWVTMRYASALLSNSHAALDFFCPGWDKDKTKKFEVIPNGIPLESFTAADTEFNLRHELSIADDAKLIGHTGRYCEAKNHQTIIAVAKQLCALRDDIFFFLCGPGVPENLKACVEEHGLQDRVLLSDYRSDIPAILKFFDVFYFPSITEGQPNALLEAIIAGIPVVAADIPPIVEAFPFDSREHLVQPLNVVDAASKIMAIIDNPIQAKNEAIRLANMAKEKYNPNICFGKTISYFANGDIR